MLVRFTVENFLSFKDEVEFSMVAGLPRKHNEHVVSSGRRNDLRLLKAGVIYGANAAGKSNLIKAMSFAKRMIVVGTNPKQRISVTPFMLDKSTDERPSKFTFEITCNAKPYVYGFELDSKQVHHEWLSEIRPSSEKLIFERFTDVDGRTDVVLGRIKLVRHHGRDFMNFLKQGTRPNELFLTKSVENDVMYFKHIYDWFDETLRLIFPNPRSSEVETAKIAEHEFERGSRDIFGLFDLGIDNVLLDDVTSPMPDSVKQEFLAAHREDQEDVAIPFPASNLYVFVTVDNKINARQFKTVHRVSHENRDVIFELTQESDGTQRLFELSSALLDLLSGNADKVYFVDELDRRLHPHMTKNLLEIFLNNTIHRPKQLIVTTHESGLLDLDLVRRDEIWFVEKDNNGISSVYSLEEFAPRYDVDVQRGYLQGRYGAIPIVPSYNVLEWAR